MKHLNIVNVSIIVIVSLVVNVMVSAFNKGNEPIYHQERYDETAKPSCVDKKGQRSMKSKECQKWYGSFDI